MESRVKYFFYAGNTISTEKKEKLVELAYAAAQEKGLTPVEILIRSELHDTTTEHGINVKDPKGWHGTFAFKTKEQIVKKVHFVTHGYTAGKDDFVLTEATLAGEKPDRTLRKNAKPVWPDESTLEEYSP